MKHKLITSILLLLLVWPTAQTKPTSEVGNGSWCLRPLAVGEGESRVPPRRDEGPIASPFCERYLAIPYNLLRINRMYRFGQITTLAGEILVFGKAARDVLRNEIYPFVLSKFSDDDQSPLILASILQSVFQEARKDPNYTRNTRIVSLRAGAEPIHEMLKAAARITGDFPEERIHSAWATMGNLKAVMKDPLQGAYFLKYLCDEGILTPDTTRMIFVDTDSRSTAGIGTEVLIYKTLLNREIVLLANSIFGLSIPVYNEPQGQHTTTMLFVYLSSPQAQGGFRMETLLGRYAISPADYMTRMDVRSISLPQGTNAFSISAAIDQMLKLEAIEDRFVLVDGNRVRPVVKPPDSQYYKGLSLLIMRQLTYLCLIGEVLNMLEAFGYHGMRAEFDAYLEQVRSDIRDAILWKYGHRNREGAGENEQMEKELSTQI